MRDALVFNSLITTTCFHEHTNPGQGGIVLQRGDHQTIRKLGHLKKLEKESICKQIEISGIRTRFFTGTYLDILGRERCHCFVSSKGYSQILAPSGSSIATSLQEVIIFYAFV